MTALSELAELSDLAAEVVAAVSAASTVEELRALDAAALGKKGPLAQRKAQLGGLAPDDRRVVGQALNAAKEAIEAAVQSRRRTLEAGARAALLEAERLDLTEVGRARRRGHLHLVTQTRDELEDVFVGMGFQVAEGPEVETDWHNFEALNIPPAHPARSAFDTLYVDWGEPESTVLRTHTSPVQIRVMTTQEPPIYSVMPGRVYRQDTPDASHLPNFHQIEGLVVDRGITFGDLAGTIDLFTEAYFGRGIRSRLRPSYFPFTEPSAEFDITCPFCGGEGCRTCGRTGWIELGGCGMVHPNVFRAVGYDPEVWSGYAFGFGIDRLAMNRHGIDDIRELIVGDIRFLEQF